MKYLGAYSDDLWNRIPVYILFRELVEEMGPEFLRLLKRNRNRKQEET